MKKDLNNVILLFVTSFVVWIINYFYHPMMMRYLSLKEFWDFATLLAILKIFLVFINSISIFFVKEFVLDKNWLKTRFLINYIFKKLFLLWIVVFLFFILLWSLIAWFLKIDNINYIYILWFLIFLSFIWVYKWSFFRWKKYFKIISFLKFSNSISRLWFGLILVYFWFNVYGALWWILISKLLFFIIWFIIIKKILKKYPEWKVDKDKILFDFMKNKKQIFIYLIWTFTLALLLNLDIIFAKHFFTENIAWSYAWISIIAKFIIVLSTSIEIVYYPTVVSNRKINWQLIFKLIFFYIFITFFALVFFYFLWGELLSFLKPWLEKYLNKLYLLIIYCWLLSLLNFIVKILITFNKNIILFVLLLFVIITILFLSIFTIYSILTLVLTFIFLVTILLLFSLIYIIYLYFYEA